MTHPNRRDATLTMLGALALTGASSARAQGAASYPSRPIRLIVPFTPGGSADILGRAIGQELTKSMGQSVVIENIGGAGGSVGADKAAHATPDGYTLFMGHIGTLAVNPHIYPKLPYDPIKDFTPVAWVANVVNVLAVHPSVPAKTLKDLVAYAQANPGKLNYGSGGNGSAAHLTTEYLKLQTKTDLIHVPYKGTAPAVQDLVAGQTQVIFTGAPALLPFFKTGQLRAIAVSSTRRLDVLPDVPTVAESGYPGFEADQWYGIVVPTGVPADIVRKLNTHINQALNAPELKARLQTEGAIAAPTTPEKFGEHIRAELARWKPVVLAANIKPS
ncbi:tripartite tricarboxylate transporter substrate binding protein [Hylemonella gracilis]|uniref:Tripartite tricarboxylate transporter substrate binding protein n=1 Tax=Hylemonella gracilis TaxID=80880 RepID=A0A4P6ULP2_9BURK|nr:tripartite tricarboxylate transporter substrate binding protein [Hylemonella gracilis]QBK04997.1 tripartite tricarboxylate transporter substrate binding protein [Hylemonella gracilis]